MNVLLLWLPIRGASCRLQPPLSYISRESILKYQYPKFNNWRKRNGNYSRPVSTSCCTCNRRQWSCSREAKSNQLGNKTNRIFRTAVWMIPSLRWLFYLHEWLLCCLSRFVSVLGTLSNTPQSSTGPAIVSYDNSTSDHCPLSSGIFSTSCIYEHHAVP